MKMRDASARLGMAWVLMGIISGAFSLSACSLGPQPQHWPQLNAEGRTDNTPFTPVQRPPAAALASKADLALLEESVDPVYRIGPGDVLRVEVFGRAEVSGRQVVGPDGRISVPLVGEISIGDLTREAAAETVASGLRAFYTHPRVTLSIDEYTSNHVTVLGRVERAGVQRFAHPPTLAEVLASSGAMPILDKQATLTRGAIMRGRDKLIWIDLKALLNGDPAFNIRMKRGDIVFIPDSADTSVYVLGAVTKPGSYRLTPRMTVIDALSQAGGPTENASPDRIGIYRAGSRRVEVIDFTQLIQPDRSINYALEDGDVLFVPQRGLADLGYALRQISPALGFISFGMTLNAVKP